MKLISMKDFVLKQIKPVMLDQECYKAIDIIEAHAKFLNQTLELWMFVPCDEEGNIVELKPIDHVDFEGEDGSFYQELYANQPWHKAKERVLFGGVTMSERMHFSTKQFTYRIGKLVAHQTDYRHNGDVIQKFRFGNLTVEDLLNPHKTIFEQEIELTPTALKQIGL